MLKMASLGVICMILVGVFFRRQKLIHIPLMVGAFSIDIALLVYIEITRDAIEKTIHGPHPYVIFHVVLCTVALLLNIALLRTGYKVLKKQINKNIHRKLAIWFLIFRLGNYLTSLNVDNYTH